MGVTIELDLGEILRLFEEVYYGDLHDSQLMEIKLETIEVVRDILIYKFYMDFNVPLERSALDTFNGLSNLERYFISKFDLPTVSFKSIATVLSTFDTITDVVIKSNYGVIIKNGY